MDDGPVLNVVRLGLIYLVIITITIIIQAIANFLMKKLVTSLEDVDLPVKTTILMILLLYIVFVCVLIDILIWTVVVLTTGFITDFLEAFSFAADNFTTLGGDESLAPPWGYLGPVMSINGIIIIGFAGASVYDALYNHGPGGATHPSK